MPLGQNLRTNIRMSCKMWPLFRWVRRCCRCTRKQFAPLVCPCTLTKVYASSSFTTRATAAAAPKHRFFKLPTRYGLPFPSSIVNRPIILVLFGQALAHGRAPESPKVPGSDDFDFDDDEEIDGSNISNAASAALVEVASCDKLFLQCVNTLRHQPHVHI